MNLWCVGRNYADHAKELGNAVPQEPLIFLKAGSCLSFDEKIALPDWAEEIHHEIEIAFQFGAELQWSAVALALDLTERKRQSEAKSKGQPWTLAKSFTGACPMSEPRRIQEIPSEEDYAQWPFHLDVNGQCRQKAKLSEALFSPEMLSAYVRKHFPVQPGDWLLTGTPAGVGPLASKDNLHAQWGSFLEARWKIS